MQHFFSTNDDSKTIAPKTRGASYTLALITLLFFCLHTPTHAAIAPSTATAQTFIEETLQKTQQLSANQLSKELRTRVDFETLTRTAFGRFYTTVKPAEFNKVKTLLTNIIDRSVTKHAKDFFRDVEIKLNKETSPETANTATAADTAPTATDSVVHLKSVLNKNGERTTVEYWVYQAGEASDASNAGKIQIIDVAIDGNRWSTSLQDQFEAVIEKSNIKGLVGKLENKLAQLR